MSPATVPRSKARRAIVIALVLATAIAAYAFNRPEPAARIPGELLAVLWPEPRPLPEFTLTDHRQGPLTRDQFQSRWTFLFFGYTACPDVCPTTLAVLQGIAERLQAPDGTGIEAGYVFVSVDPARDTPQRLAEYVGYFHPALIGATGSDEALAALARGLPLRYERGASRGADDYDLNHTASILLIDPQARLFGKFSPPHDAAEIVQQFHRLREHYGRTSG